MKKCLPYLLPIRSILFLLVFIIGAFVTGKAISDISYWWSIAASLINIFTILILLYVARKSQISYWELINYQKGKTRVREMVGISVGILLIGMAGMYFAGYICYGVIPYAAPMMIAPIPIWLAIIAFFFAINYSFMLVLL